MVMTGHPTPARAHTLGPMGEGQVGCPSVSWQSILSGGGHTSARSNPGATELTLWPCLSCPGPGTTGNDSPGCFAPGHGPAMGGDRCPSEWKTR